MQISRFLCCVLGLAMVAGVVSEAADSKGTTFTDPEKAGIEYQLQGEYVGEVEVDGQPQTIGVQVISLGDGKFRGIGYFGGLPGDGWSRGDKKNSAEGQLDDGVLRFTVDEADVEVKDGMLTIAVAGETLAKLEKVDRKSPTLGTKPPTGATVLFDGRSVAAFENGKLVEDQWLAATNVFTKQKFGDHTLHIEFRTPFMPAARGQARGNSGVYMQGRYELQVLDSFGLEGENNECGGIYSIAKPNVNMCLPPLVWQTYDIDFTAARFDDGGQKVKNARVTVKHNGVVIHDDLELTHGTPGYHAEGPGPDVLFLQNHGNPVVFRNIWVVEN